MVLIVTGVIIVAVGAYHVNKGASRGFLDDLKGRSGDLAIRLGVLGAQPYGVVLPVFAAMGIITYGFYSFVMARYTKM